MLTPCVNCGFYVKQTDEFCPNCGFLTPTVPINGFSKTGLINLKRFFIICFLISLVLFIPLTTINSVAFAILTSLAVSMIISILLESIINLTLESTEYNKRILGNVNNLKTKFKIIEKRVSELNKRSQKIDAVLDKINDNDGKSLQEVRHKLLSAREIVMNQFARYELQKRKIELVRIQNGVSFYLFGIHRLNEFETENGLVTIETTRAEINQIRQNLTRHDAIDFPANTLPEKQAFLTQLDETEDSCQKLREALLSRQAARALQDISPIAESVKLPGSKELAHESNVFNIQTTLTDFSESFDELEREYKRIKAEEETKEKLLAE